MHFLIFVIHAYIIFKFREHVFTYNIQKSKIGDPISFLPSLQSLAGTASGVI